jgi:hypothetical protein
MTICDRTRPSAPPMPRTTAPKGALVANRHLAQALQILNDRLKPGHTMTSCRS